MPVMKSGKRLQAVSLPLAGVGMVLTIAALAIVSLWILLNVYNRSVRTTAAMSVLNLGKIIAMHLAEQPVIRQGESDMYDWSDFSRLVRSIHSVEDGLQFVSVKKRGVTVFHEQMRPLDGAAITNSVMPVPGEVAVDRQLITVGPEQVPVVTFTFTPAAGEAGVDSVQIGISREAIDREGLFPSVAMRSMFRVALLTILVAFGFCAAVVVWMLKKEAAIEENRRRQEHLAFAGVMANGIVHDFRNPMSSLKLDVQMLARESTRGRELRPERLADLSSRIQGTLDRMDKVFEEFLYLSRPSSKSHELVNLGELVRDCLAFLGPRFERAEVSLDVNISSERLDVMCSPNALSRAFTNILTNAEEFSDEGESVSVGLFESDGYAVFEVCDSGRGISDSDKPRIFELFFSKRPGGTGMGLFLAKTGIEDSNGRIEVYDNPSGGSCFRTVIPLAHAGAQEEDRQQ